MAVALWNDDAVFVGLNVGNVDDDDNDDNDDVRNDGL